MTNFLIRAFVQLALLLAIAPVVTGVIRMMKARFQPAVDPRSGSLAAISISCCAREW